MNGPLRDSKGTDLSAHTPQHLLAVENELNNRPRHVLGDRAPADLFAAVASTTVDVARYGITRQIESGRLIAEPTTISATNSSAIS